MNRNSFHLILCLLAVAATLRAETLQGQSETAVPPGLSRTEPIVCASNSDLVVHGRFIETAGNGIVVQGNCDVVIVNSHIVAGGVAVLVQGNGGAVTNSYIEGGKAALVAEGNGDIHYSETTLRGATRTSGQGEIAGDDGAFHRSGGTVGILGKVRIGLSGIRVQEGDSMVSIGLGGIVVKDGTETVSIGAGPGGLRIDTGDAILTLDAGVTVDGNLLRLGLGAKVGVSDGWRAASHSPYRTSDTDRLLLELGATAESGQLLIGLAGDVLFELDSATIQSPGATELRKLAHILRPASRR